MLPSFQRILVGAGVCLSLAWIATPTSASADEVEIASRSGDVELLALAIWHEARGESPEARTLVAEVILERVRDDRWPGSVEDVLRQRSQFFGLDLSHRPPAASPLWRACLKTASQVLIAGPREGVNHFHAVDVMPAWHDPRGVVKRVGRHVFLKL